MSLLPRSQKLSGLSILVVEDDSDNQELLVFVLESEGARVTAVGTAQDAIDCLKSSRPDIIVCDIGLSGSGYDLLQQWRDYELNLDLDPVPAIAMTGFSDDQSREDIYASGFQLLITKPFDPFAIPPIIANLFTMTCLNL